MRYQRLLEYSPTNFYRLHIGLLQGALQRQLRRVSPQEITLLPAQEFETCKIGRLWRSKEFRNRVKECRILASKHEAKDCLDLSSFPRERKDLNAACWNSSAAHVVHSNSSYPAVQKSSPRTEDPSAVVSEAPRFAHFRIEQSVTLRLGALTT